MMRRIPAALALLLACLALDIVALVWMAVAFIAGSPRGWRLAIAQDQLGNALAGGDEDETISSRAWRKQTEWPWGWLRPAIDWVAARLGDADHCRKAFEAERAKAATRAGWRFKEGN